jgi:hypothetical protein
VQHSPLTPIEAVVFALCAYECVALLGDRDRIPPISRVCWRHPALIGPLVGGLTIHLLSPLLNLRRRHPRRSR